MARGRGEKVPPSTAAAAFPFEHMIIADPTGRILAAVLGKASGDTARPLPQAAVSLAERIGADGLMPPRSFGLREIIGGHLLSVAGDVVCAHAVYAQAPPASETMNLLRVVLDFEAAYAAHLVDPKAAAATFSAARARAERVYRAKNLPALDAPVPVRLFVHATVEPRGPGIMVLLRLRNFTREPVSGVAVSFQSAKDFVRPAALYGTGASVDLAAVQLLEPLPPGEKLLELRLEPQEPRDGPLRLSLTAPGFPEAPCRPLQLEVRLPVLRPPNTDFVMLARKVALDDADPRDVFRLRYTRAVSAEFAFERVKEAVTRERPLQLMEFSSPAPAYHEAWYLASVAPKGEPMLVEVAVRGPGRLIEVRVATKRLADLLGVKAEYRRRIRELLSERFMGKRVVVQRTEALSPSIDEAAPHLHAALLLKHLQGEIGAAELWHEMRRTATGGSGEGWQFVAPYAQEMMDEIEGPGKARRPPRLSAEQAQQELLGGVSDMFTRLMSPIALEQTARMDRPGARLRTGLDRGAEAEAEAAED